MSAGLHRFQTIAQFNSEQGKEKEADERWYNVRVHDVLEGLHMKNVCCQGVLCPASLHFGHLCLPLQVSGEKIHSFAV